MSYIERLRKEKPKTETTCLVDEAGIMIVAEWHREGGIVIDALSFTIAGKTIDITANLDDAQYYTICEQINSRI